MSIRAMDPMGPSRLDNVVDTYRAERLRAQGRANARADSARRMTEMPFAHCLKQAAEAQLAQQARLDAQSVAVNRAEIAAQTVLQVRAQAANDLGTIQGLLPLQAYRFVVSPPLDLTPPPPTRAF